MLAYRHGFHAGMHADVLKHVVLTQVLQYVGGKATPYTYLDTHAGAGAYELTGPVANKTAEYQQGIARLWHRSGLPPAVDDYVALVRRFNGGDKLLRYPGSPAIAQMLRGPQDRLRLYELHPTDHRSLDEMFAGAPHAQVAHADGFAALKADLPPPSRRGVVLIDPSYEIKTDYTRVAQALREALTRFAPAIVLVWYPELPTRESQQLPLKLRKIAEDLAPRGWLHAQLSVQAPSPDGFGLLGSGMFVTNPPFVLHDGLKATLPFLVKALGQHDGAHHLLQQHAV